MIVIDANAALEIVLETNIGRQLMSVFELEDTTAPLIFVDEVANSLWKYQRIGDITKQECVNLHRAALSLVDCYVNDDELYPEALSRAIQTNHSVYDMLYLTLAKRCDAQLFTRDKKLIKLCHENNVDCIDLVDLLSTVEE